MKRIKKTAKQRFTKGKKGRLVDQTGWCVEYDQFMQGVNPDHRGPGSVPPGVKK
jgi:hypothetical protein